MPEMKKHVASVRPHLNATLQQLVSPLSFEPLLGLHGAAAVLGMHWMTLEGKARAKEVPALKVGKRWRFRLSSLKSWLDYGLERDPTPDHADVTRQERCS